MFRDFFRGRYGMDTIGYVLLFAAIIVSNFKSLWFIGFAIGGYAVFRILSKDINKRYLELQKFNQITKKISKPIQSKYSQYKMMSQQRKIYIFLQCPKCKKTLRLPKNKGKLQVTCPVCKNEFLKKT